MADGWSRGITVIGIIYLLSYCSGCPPQPVSMFIHESTTTYIESPWYSAGSNYPPNADCRWILQTNIDRVIQINGDNIYLEGRPYHCKPYDYLMIFDGKDTNDDMLGEFCGDNVSVDVKTTENFAFVLFKSDQLVQSRGFKLEITSKPKPIKNHKDKGPNSKAIIGGVVGGVVCSVLFVTFACCCLHNKRCPCRRNNRPNRTVSPQGSRITVQPASERNRHVRVGRTDSHEPSVSAIAPPYLYFNPRSSAAFERPDSMGMSVLSPPPYIPGPPPPLESSNSSNSSSSPPPPYMEQDPHPHAVQSDSIPSYSSR